MSRQIEDKLGWVTIHRRILDNPIATKPDWAWLWVYLLLRANHEDKRIIWNKKELLIKRGQLLTGLYSMSKESGVSIQSIRSAITYLISTNQITSQTTNRWRIITICNYEEYQRVTSKSTNKQQSSNNLATTNNNVNNVNNVSQTEIETSKNSHTPCSSEEIKEIANKLGVRVEDVSLTHQIILNKIKAKEFKNKTVYLTLENWVLMGIERGTIKKKVAVDPLANYKQGSV